MYLSLVGGDGLLVAFDPHSGGGVSLFHDVSLDLRAAGLDGRRPLEFDPVFADVLDVGDSRRGRLGDFVLELDRRRRGRWLAESGQVLSLHAEFVV